MVEKFVERARPEQDITQQGGRKKKRGSLARVRVLSFVYWAGATLVQGEVCSKLLISSQFGRGSGRAVLLVRLRWGGRVEKGRGTDR